MSCSVCPPIPGKDVQPESVLCQELDDMLKHISATEAVSLTDLLLMAGSASSTPGFHMLVQYVATICHLQSVPVVQPQLRLHDQQTLDVSQVHILAHGQKSLVVQLGRENAVYKVQCTCTMQSVSCVCALCTCSADHRLLHTFCTALLHAVKDQPWRRQDHAQFFTSIFPQIAHSQLVGNELMIHRRVTQQCHLSSRATCMHMVLWRELVPTSHS